MDVRYGLAADDYAALPPLFLGCAFRSARDDAGFHRVLERPAHLGTTVGARLGVTATLFLVGVYVVIGTPPGWSYVEGHVTLWDTAVFLGCAFLPWYWGGIPT